MSKKEKNNIKILRSGSYVYINDLNHIIHSSDFEFYLGSVTSEFRFKPSKTTMEQGLTTEILENISLLIKERAGIGKKKAEAIKKV
tara:strand:- start:2170 stop:2427 length:258 start_codon:yes stop_codon:yes gene_type:complete